MVDKSYAIISDGKVVNTALAEEEFALQQGWVELPDGFGIGDFYDGEFIKREEPEPEPEVPQEIEGWQAEVIMRMDMVGEQSVWDRVQEIIDAMEDPAQQLVARTMLARGRVRRNSPMLNTLIEYVPLTAGQVDSMFVRGAALEA